MKCLRCQQENPPQAKFCLECATRLALRCANCGTQLPPGAKFCFECATPVSASGSPPRFASPETYTPKHLGSDLQMDYTAVGQSTHLAARMEQMAIPGSILITGATLALAEGYVGVRPLGAVPVKGLNELIEAFELTSAGLARTRLQAAAARGLTRFVGRESEVHAIREGLERARGGHGQLIALVGEPGVGKSRLVWEFTHSHRTHGWLVLESSSVPYGKTTAFLPVIHLLKAYFQIEERDDARKIRERVTGKLLTLDQAFAATLPTFLALLDVPTDDPGWLALEPSQRRQQTLDAIKRLVLCESQIQPLLLIFEDLHWVDGESQALLDSLVESLPSAHVLLLVNFSPGVRASLGRQDVLYPAPSRPAAARQVHASCSRISSERTPASSRSSLC
jgi:ribosomal protein L40E